MDTRALIRGYLAAGVSQRVAAETCGVSESYVSQLMTEPEFREHVQSELAARGRRYIEMDDLADQTQHLALQRLRKVTEIISKPETLLRAIQVLDQMKRRSTPAVADSETKDADLVRISLPRGMAARFAISVDTTNRVTEIAGQTFVPASGKLIDMMAEQHIAGGHGYDHGREAGILPGATGAPSQGEGAGALLTSTSAGTSSAGEAAGASGSKDSANSSIGDLL